MPALNIPAILAAVRAAEVEALETVAATVVAEARRRAPVRKVFKEQRGFRRRFRPLTPLERSIAIRRAETFYAHDDFRRRRAVAHLRNYARVELPRRGSMNSLARSRKLRVLGYERGGQFTSTSGAMKIGRRGFDPGPALSPLMTARGRYEVRSGRAIHREVLSSGNVRVQVGGRLKASIESEGVVTTDKGAEVRVTAGVRYAKFVEFPTVRTAAQPFLRPALQDARSRLKRVVAEEVRKALGG